MTEELKHARPAQHGGLNIGADRTLLQPGDLEVADGVRPLIDGVVSSRNGRVWAGIKSQTVPIRGYHPFYDESIVTAAESPKSAYVLNHVYKAGSRLFVNAIDTDSFDGDSEARFQEYAGRVYACDGVSDPKVIRRVLETVGQPPLHGAFRMGIVFPTTDDRPTVTKDVTPGSGNFNPSYQAITMQVTARIVCSDGEFSSNPSLSSDIDSGLTSTLLNFGSSPDVNTRLTISWAALEASIPDDVTEVEVWIQVTPIVFVNNTIPVHQTPLAYKKVPADALDDGTFDRTDPSYNSTCRIETSIGIENWQELEVQRGYHRGAPPVLYDFRMVNDVMVAAARPDVVYREALPDGDPVSRVFGREGETRAFLPKDTKIVETKVTGSHLFYSLPFQPQYMNEWVIVGDGAENITAIAALGTFALVFTSNSTYVFDPFSQPTPSLRKAPVSGGTDAPDSVIETSEMILFKTTSGTWYVFNGATFEQVSNDIAPLFRKEHQEYSGYYKPVDQTLPQRIRGTATSERAYITYPEKDQEKQSLLVADLRRGIRWSIDTAFNYSIVHYIPRENRILAIDERGDFFWIEEGFTDAIVTTGIPTPTAIEFECTLRRQVGRDLRVQDWERFHVELNTNGESLEVEVRADDDPKRVYKETISTTSRQKLKRWLPSNIRGQYATLTLRGNVTNRVEVFGIDLRAKERGEF